MNVDTTCLGPPVLASQSRINRFTEDGVWGSQSLPAIFYRHADTRADMLALSDCLPDGDGGTRRDCTYAEVDLAVRHIAARFDACGLKPGDIVALQLPPQIEACVTMLACLGLGLIVCALPTSWRRMEIETALDQVGARAIVTWSDGDDCGPVMTACSAAFRVSSIRYVFAFSDRPADGVTPLHLNLDEDAERLERDQFPFTFDANALAVVTWDMVSAAGPRAVARSHNECIASGLATVVAASLGDGATILSPYLLSGYSGLAAAFVPWLMTGGLLALHRPFDLEIWREQVMIYEPDLAPIPAPLGRHLAVAAAYAAAHPPILALVRDASARATTSVPAVGNLRAIDIQCLGDVAVIVRDLQPFASPSVGELPLGTVGCGHNGGPTLLETRRGEHISSINGGVNPLLVAGPAVPSAISVPGAQRHGFRPAADSDDFVATGYHLHSAISLFSRGMIAADPDIVHVGSVVVSLGELGRLYAGLDGVADAAAIAIDDEIMGARLAAAIVAERDASPDLSDLAAHLAEIGAAEFKVPERVVLVDAIPRRDDGTIDRKILLECL